MDELFALTTGAFHAEGWIPSRHTCEGDDLSPALAWTGVPENARSLALIVDDPDASNRTFTHWVAWGIDPTSTGLAEGESPPHEGLGTSGHAGYHGPCPPQGDGPHRYFFKLYALDSEIELEPSVGKTELEQAITGHVLAEAELMGRYERPLNAL